MLVKKSSSADFGSCNKIIYFNHNNIGQYEWDVPSPNQLLLYRKFSDIIHDIETTLTTTDNDTSLNEALSIIHDGSIAIRQNLSEYISKLMDEQTKLRYQLTDQYINSNNINLKDKNKLSLLLEKLNNKIAILINCEYVWNLAEIFWLDQNDSICITLRFIELIQKYRDNTNHSNDNNLLIDSDQVWNSIYLDCIHGKLDNVINHLNEYPSDRISIYSKKLIIDLLKSSPLYDIDMLPSREDINKWRNDISVVISKITEKKHLLPLLHILLGNSDYILKYSSNNWLDWITGYLLYNSPFIDYENDLYKILAFKKNTKFDETVKGSIEWIFAGIMMKEYTTILEYTNNIFPKWFATHLCYLLRRQNTPLMLQWPRLKDIKTMYDGADYNSLNDQQKQDIYNQYIRLHPQMTMIEWIFEYYIEDLLFVSSDSYLWLKNYLIFFKRRGVSMLTNIFQNIEIKSDKNAYLMLQICDELKLDNEIYDMICLRMAQQSYINISSSITNTRSYDNLGYGRITYWCCKSRNQASMINLDKYLFNLIDQYLSSPIKYIDILHNICDNANIDENDINNNIQYSVVLNLVSKLRDMYLCRYDLQKLDIKYKTNMDNNNNKKKKQLNNNNNIKKQTPFTPFTRSRGRLIDELTNNKHIKNIIGQPNDDEFDIASDDNDNDDDDDVIQGIIHYPDLHQSNISISSYGSHNSNSGPFPKHTILKNDEESEKSRREFLMSNLLSPPRPTSNRNIYNSHRKSSHKKININNKNKNNHQNNKNKHKKIKKIQRNKHNVSINLNDLSSDDSDDFCDDIDDDDDSNDDADADAEEQYRIECCDIIISYIHYLSDIISTSIYDKSFFIRIILFSLPVLSHKYSPNSLTVTNILSISHEWYKIKFFKNKNKTKINQFNKNEINLINEILANLQSKVLASTYSNNNYASIWLAQQQDNNDDGMDQDDDIKDEQNNTQDTNDNQFDTHDTDDDDIIDID